MTTKVKLSTEQVTAIDNARRVLNDIVSDMDALDQCGDNCDDLRRQKEQISSALDKIVQFFGYRRE